MSFKKEDHRIIMRTLVTRHCLCMDGPYYYHNTSLNFLEVLLVVMIARIPRENQEFAAEQRARELSIYVYIYTSSYYATCTNTFVL